MMVKSFLTGETPRELARNVQLEDHLTCTCKCEEQDECNENKKDNLIQTIRGNSDVPMCPRNNGNKFHEHVFTIVFGLTLG